MSVCEDIPLQRHGASTSADAFHEKYGKETMKVMRSMHKMNEVNMKTLIQQMKSIERCIAANEMEDRLIRLK